MNEHYLAPEQSDVGAAACDSQKANDSGAQTLEKEREKQDQSSLDNAFLDKWATDFNGQSEKSWFHGANFLTFFFGVFMPSLLPIAFLVIEYKRAVLLLLSQPIENFLLFSLLLIIPMSNFKMLRSSCRNNFVFGLKPGITAGLAFGTALVCALVCVAASCQPSSQPSVEGSSVFLTYLLSIGLFYVASALTTLQLVLNIRKTKELESSRKRILTYLMIGSLASLSSIAIAESQSMIDHFIERKALSSDAKISQPALALLRKLGVERQLRLLCADQRSAGLAGIFLPIKKNDCLRLYFAVEGKPFVIENKTEWSEPTADLSQPFTNSIYQMNAEQLKNFAVGEKIPGISLVRSTVNGNLHPDNLSATVVWTMVFQNEGSTIEKARAEISIPESAAITGMKLWEDGKVIDASVAFENNYLTDAYRSSADGMVTELGRGKYLLKGRSLEPDKQVKMQVTMVLPMDLDQLDSAQIRLPQLVASNFSLEGEHTLELLSNNDFLDVSGFKTAKRSDGLNVLSGQLKTEQIEGSAVSILCKRKPVTTVACCEDNGVFKRGFESARPLTLKEGPGTKDFGFFLERCINKSVVAAPGRIVVVVDGSLETNNYKQQIVDALQGIPAGIPTTLMVASTEDKSLSEPEDLTKALQKFKSMDLKGGQDNLKSLVRASEFAGQTKEGVVLWIHGRQPAFNKQIYIISPFAYKPALYEFAYDPAETAEQGYFENHSEISEFVPVARVSSLKSDLSRFLKRWQAGRVQYSVEPKLSFRARDSKFVQDEVVATELKALLARNLCFELIRKERGTEAGTFAIGAHVVSPQSSLFFDGSRSQSVTYNAPVLQGATNGTVTPAGAVIQGVNTSGTVRVNNLANLEAGLNILANFSQILLMIAGGILAVRGIMLKDGAFKIGTSRGDNAKGKAAYPLDRVGLICAGLLLVLVGLSVPGLMNYLVASARDAALFN